MILHRIFNYYDIDCDNYLNDSELSNFQVYIYITYYYNIEIMFLCWLIIMPYFTDKKYIIQSQ